MAVVSRSRRQNITVTLHDILRSSSLIKLAETVKSGTVNLPDHVEVLDQGFGLSPIQQIYFLAAKGHQGSSRFNQSYTIRFSRYISVESVQSALGAIVSSQSMLRARLKLNATGEWEQQISSVSFLGYYKNPPSNMILRITNLPSASDIIKLVR
jgi:hypothetical protein